MPKKRPRRFNRPTIGLLKFSAPIFKVVQINPLARYGAQHELPRPPHIEMRRVVMQYGKTLNIRHQSPVRIRSTNCFTVGTNPLE